MPPRLPDTDDPSASPAPPPGPPGLATRLLLGLIRGYQLLLSPFLGTNCRYHPGCSTYAREAVLRFGALRGGWLGLRRIARCHPFAAGGVDPVPDRYVAWGRSPPPGEKSAPDASRTGKNPVL